MMGSGLSDKMERKKKQKRFSFLGCVFVFVFFFLVEYGPGVRLGKTQSWYRSVEVDVGDVRQLNKGEI